MRSYFMQTSRLGFSLWQEDDQDLADSLWGDPAVTKFICASGTFTDQDIKDRLQKEIRNNELHGIQYWPLFSLETGELIGCCGLRPYDPENGIYELGFHIRSLHWGNKYAAEAAAAVIRHAFDTMKVKGLFAGHNPKNAVSKKVLQRLGFRYTHDEYYAPTGLRHPAYRYP